jgi:hypothetical protein
MHYNIPLLKNKKVMKPLHSISVLFFFLFFLNTISAQQKIKTTNDKIKVKTPGGEMKMERKKSFTPLDTLAIEHITGMKGKSNNGEYKLTIPQYDLDIKVDGFKIIPAMGLSSWIDFAPSPNGAMIMADIIVTETDLKPVQREIIHQGLTISAIHNHFVRNHPNVMYMHVGGSGPVEQIAQKIKSVLDKIIELRGGDPAKGTASNEAVANSLDKKSLDAILGYAGEINKGVYKYTIGRPDVNLEEHAVRVTTFMGFNTWAAFQGSTDHAAVAGDFTMLEDEVAPVIKALVENGIEVVAVHNHMIHEQPRIFFLHYWGVGNAEQLAKGLKAALNQAGKNVNMKM